MQLVIRTALAVATFFFSLTAAAQSTTVSVSFDGTGQVQLQPGAFVCTADCEQEVPATSVLVLVAIGTQGATFAGWGGACAGVVQPVCSLTPGEAVAVSVEFRAPVQPELSVTGTAGGSLEGRTGAGPALTCDGECNTSASFPQGTVVSLIATADPGFSIARWTGACEASNTGGGGRRTRYGDNGGPRETCNVRMDADTTAGVEFAADPATVNLLSVTIEGQGRVEEVPGRDLGDGVALACPGQCEIEVPSGTTVRLKAVPADGQVLAAWDGVCVSRSRTRRGEPAGVDVRLELLVGHERVRIRGLARSRGARGPAPRQPQALVAVDERGHDRPLADPSGAGDDDHERLGVRQSVRGVRHAAGRRGREVAGSRRCRSLPSAAVP